MVKESHTCEEGGADLRISFWYLQKLLKWANKKQNSFNIYYVAFKRKKQRKSPVDIIIRNRYDMIYSS